MAKTLCDRCGAEIPAGGKIWDFSWFSRFGGGDYEPDGEPDEVLLCSCCHKEVDMFIKQQPAKQRLKAAAEKYTGKKKQKAWDLHEKGYKNGEIAEMLGTTRQYVASMLHDYRMENEISEEKPVYVDAGKVLALRRAGWKVRDIAGDMGISEAAVCETLNNHVTAG